MSSANPKVQEPSMEEILASIRRIIADDQESSRAAPAPAPAPNQPPEEDEDVLDLAELAPEPLPAKLDLDHEDVSFRDSDGQIDFDSIDVEDEPDPEPDPLPPPPPPLRPAAPQPAAKPAQAPDPLLSSEADSSVANAFSMLSSTVLSSNPRTLEDLVKEMLRPMLKSWLDENLPPLVERLVQAEIQRVARGGR
jgi:cell pole-organizing protein PopZ